MLKPAKAAHFGQGDFQIGPLPFLKEVVSRIAALTKANWHLAPNKKGAARKRPL
jgi:hypothetical protein